MWNTYRLYSYILVLLHMHYGMSLATNPIPNDLYWTNPIIWVHVENNDNQTYTKFSYTRITHDGRLFVNGTLTVYLDQLPSSETFEDYLLLMEALSIQGELVSVVHPDTTNIGIKLIQTDNFIMLYLSNLDKQDDPWWVVVVVVFVVAAPVIFLLFVVYLVHSIQRH
jgi:hypothetical protein